VAELIDGMEIVVENTVAPTWLPGSTYEQAPLFYLDIPCGYFPGEGMYTFRSDWRCVFGAVVGVTFDGEQDTSPNPIYELFSHVVQIAVVYYGQFRRPKVFLTVRHRLRIEDPNYPIPPTAPTNYYSGILSCTYRLEGPEGGVECGDMTFTAYDQFAGTAVVEPIENPFP